MQAQSMVREETLEDGMATHSSNLALKVPWTEQPGKLVCAGMHAKLLQSCLTLHDPVNCNSPGFYVHGIFQASILELVTMPSLRGSSRPRDQTHIFCVSCIGRWFLYHLRQLGSPKVQSVGSQSQTQLKRLSTHAQEVFGVC